jgi:hypothetical protein
VDRAGRRRAAAPQRKRPVEKLRRSAAESPAPKRRASMMEKPAIRPTVKPRMHDRRGVVQPMAAREAEPRVRPIIKASAVE